MDDLDRQIAAYEARRDELERDYHGRHVVFHDGELFGDYGTLDEAADAAVQSFGRGPYLIRQVGAPETITLPASVLYGVGHANA